MEAWPCLASERAPADLPGRSWSWRPTPITSPRHTTWSRGTPPCRRARAGAPPTPCSCASCSRGAAPGTQTRSRCLGSWSMRAGMLGNCSERPADPYKQGPVCCRRAAAAALTHPPAPPDACERARAGRWSCGASSRCPCRTSASSSSSACSPGAPGRAPPLLMPGTASVAPRGPLSPAGGGGGGETSARADGAAAGGRCFWFQRAGRSTLAASQDTLGARRAACRHAARPRRARLVAPHQRCPRRRKRRPALMQRQAGS